MSSLYCQDVLRWLRYHAGKQFADLPLLAGVLHCQVVNFQLFWRLVDRKVDQQHWLPHCHAPERDSLQQTRSKAPEQKQFTGIRTRSVMQRA